MFGKIDDVRGAPKSQFELVIAMGITKQCCVEKGQGDLAAKIHEICTFETSGAQKL